MLATYHMHSIHVWLNLEVFHYDNLETNFRNARIALSSTSDKGSAIGCFIIGDFRVMSFIFGTDISFRIQLSAFDDYII